MECWLPEQWPVNGEMNIGMSSFAERQAVLEAQVLGTFAPGLESWGHFEQQRFWPCDQLLVKQEEEDRYGDAKNSAAVSNLGPDGALNFAGCNVPEGSWQQFGFEPLPGFQSLPEQMYGSGNFQIIPMPVFHDEDYDYVQLNLPAWQTQPELSEVCCTEAPPLRPTNSSFYTLEDIMKKLPRVAPLLIPPQSMSLSIPPSPQFSSDLSFSSPPPFSGRVSCPPASSQTSEVETERQHEVPQLQSYRKPPYASVEPQSVAARHRRSKIREKIRSLEKLIPQGSKLDTARMLDEAIKYLKFLQAQVQVLETLPHADLKADLKSNPNSAEDKVNICLKSNANSDGTRKLALTNALALQRSGSSMKLSTNQMLHSLLSSSRIQKKLFNAEKIIVTVQQKEALASARPDLPTDFSNSYLD